RYGRGRFRRSVEARVFTERDGASPEGLAATVNTLGNPPPPHTDITLGWLARTSISVTPLDSFHRLQHIKTAQAGREPRVRQKKSLPYCDLIGGENGLTKSLFQLSEDTQGGQRGIRHNHCLSTLVV